MRRDPVRWLLLPVLVTAACTDTASDGTSRATGAVTTPAPSAAEPVATEPVTTEPAADPPTTATTASTTTTTTTTTTVSATTATAPAPATSGAPPATAGEPGTGTIPVDSDVIELGRSVQDRPITVVRRGEPGGTAVLVIGVIHGDEDAGEAIVDELAVADVPDGVELWLVPSMNPDGQALQLRHNANGVDLNRNFPVDWGTIAGPGDWQYAGPSAASEPETQAMVALAELVRPDLTLWYHQDLFRINPSSGRDGEVRARYAALTGLPVVPVTGGTYTGTASTWSRSIAADDGIGFTVELGASLTPDEARRHADAVLTVAAEL